MIPLSLEINREEKEAKQTLGTLNVIGRTFSCKTLELPYKDNQNYISCIPAGTYIVQKRSSRKYPFHFQVMNVPNRNLILIHFGNYHTDIKGCILVGETHTDINGDGLRDVTSSRLTLAKLYAIMPNTFKLTIK